MSTGQYTFETHDTHIFICSPQPNPFAFQLTFPLPIPATSRVRSPVNASIICVPSPGFRPSISPTNRVLFSPIDDMENRENWKFVTVHVTGRVEQTWIQHGAERFLAGTMLFLWDRPHFGGFSEVDVMQFLGSLGDEDYLQRTTGTAPNYTEADLKVLFLEASNCYHFLYARVRGVVRKFIFNRRRFRFELLREQQTYNGVPVDVNVSQDPRRSDDVLMKFYNATIIRNKAGFLEKHQNGRKMKPSAIFLQQVRIQHEEEIHLPEDVTEESSDEEEEEEHDQTVYSDGEVPKVEHEEEVTAEEYDYFRLNQVVTDSSSDDDEEEFIVVD